MARERLMRSSFYIFFLLGSILIGQSTSFIQNRIGSGMLYNNQGWSVLADIDQDGDLDVLANDDWRENNGGDCCAKKTENYLGDPVSGNGLTRNKVVIDLDRDGDMDIVTSEVWYKNDGNQNFTKIDFGGNSKSPGVQVADMDNDGDLDIVYISSETHTQINLATNDGSENFTISKVYGEADWDASDGGGRLFVADFDNDGDKDIVAVHGARYDYGSVSWFENGDSWRKRTINDKDNYQGRLSYISITDLDRDGDIDIIVGGSLKSTHDLVWHENLGGKTGFKEHQIPAANFHVSRLAAADFDNDGDIDIVVTQLQGDGKLSLFENDGSQNFSQFHLYDGLGISGSIGITGSVETGDIDNDGDIDFLINEYWYENTLDLGAATFSAADIHTTADAAQSVVAADMDNDGDLDMVSISRDDDAVTWYENDGSSDPTWAISKIAVSADSPQGLVVADMDNDGDLDIVSASHQDNTVAWYENNGADDPSWNASDISTNLDSPRKVSTADLDSDGDMDIVVSFDKGIAWYENNGATDPSWTANSIHSSASEYALESFNADMDRDGDIDIVVNGDFDGLGRGVYWFENDGSGDPSWTTIKILGLATSTPIYVADMDNDGDLDIISSSSGRENSLWWMKNNGATDPSWDSFNILDIDYVKSIFAADINKDGHLDIITTTTRDIAWHLNNGESNPSWTANHIFTRNNTKDNLSPNIQKIFVADMDNDGDLDVISASENDDTIALYKHSYDVVLPEVTSVSSAVANGAYKIGDVIPVNLTWSEAATVSGNPKIKLETGIADQYATYSSGSGTTTFTFNYTVAAGDTTSDLDYTSSVALELNGSIIVDVSGNNADLTLPSPGSSGSLSANKNIIIDGNVPSVVSVSSPTVNGGYTVGATIPIAITFNQTVTVTGTPQLTLETGTTDAVVDYTSGSGTATLTFNYVVAAGHNSTDLDYGSSSALALNSGTIKDASGNIATLTMPAPGATNSLSANKTLIIDTTSPTVSSVSSTKENAAYKVGETIPININFDDKVYVTGTPQLTLETGTADAVVDYSSGTESTKLIFNYTVASTHNSSDLDYTSTSALVLNGGVLKDSLGNAAILTLPAPATTGSLSANKAIIIDNLPPIVTIDPVDGSNTVLPTLPILINFNEYVRFIDNKEATSTNVDALITLKDSNINGTDILFDATINSDKTLITIDPIVDFASEQTVYVSISPALEDSLDHPISSASATLKMKDVITPTVSFDPSNGSYDIPGNRNITITFSEPMRNLDNTEITDANVANLVILKGNNSSGADFNFGATININKTVITIDPLFDFSASSVVYVGIGAVVEDDADNTIAPSSSIFITGIPDVIPPQVSNVTSSSDDGAYTIDDKITIQVQFDEIVLVEGNPQLKLETGVVDAIASYSGGSNSDVLNFIYIVAEEQNTIDLDYINSDALTLNGGIITDFVGNTGNLSLPDPASEGSLGYNKNIVIDTNGPPEITSVSIVDGSTLPVLGDSKMIFTTSEPVTSAKINLQSSLGDSPSASLNIDDPTHVSVNLTAPFTSGDELTLTINELTDYAGNITNGLVYNYTISLISDFNTDGSIDAADMTVLINGWSNQDYAYELGPTTGDVPNLKPALDGKFDIMDAAVLIRMWHWNLNKSGKILARYITTGKDLEYNNEDNTLGISIADNVNAVDFSLQYPQDKISINHAINNTSDKEIVLTHSDSLRGEYIITAGYLEEMDRFLQIPYLIKGREDVTITAIYRMFDKNSAVNKQGTQEITLKAIPQEFSLHQNYPNPFNPTTTINFDLPQNSRVSLVIYDIMGREVVSLFNRELTAGYHSAIWNTSDNNGIPVSAGVYLYQLQTKGFVKTKKMILLK